MSNDSTTGLVVCIGLVLFSLYTILFGLKNGIVRKRIVDSPIGNHLLGMKAVMRGLFWIAFGTLFLVIGFFGIIKALKG